MLPVDSVAVSNPIENSTDYKLQISVKIFPSGQDNFNRTGVSRIGFALSNQTFKPDPKVFGPFYFVGDKYQHFSGKVKNSYYEKYKYDHTALLVLNLIHAIV